MDAAQLERCKGVMEQILVDMRKLAVDLENTVLLRAVNQTSSISAASSSKLTATSSASPMSSPTPAPPLDFSLAIPTANFDDHERTLSISTTNSDDREHEVTNPTASSVAHSFPNLHAIPGSSHCHQHRPHGTSLGDGMFFPVICC